MEATEVKWYHISNVLGTTLGSIAGVSKYYLLSPLGFYCFGEVWIFSFYMETDKLYLRKHFFNTFFPTKRWSSQGIQFGWLFRNGLICEKIFWVFIIAVLSYMQISNSKFINWSWCNHVSYEKGNIPAKLKLCHNEDVSRELFRNINRLLSKQ